MAELGVLMVNNVALRTLHFPQLRVRLTLEVDDQQVRVRVVDALLGSTFVRFLGLRVGVKTAEHGSYDSFGSLHSLELLLMGQTVLDFEGRCFGPEVRHFLTLGVLGRLSL